MSLPMFSHASKLHFIKKWSKLKGTMFEIFHHLFLKIARKGVKNVLRMTNDISKLSSGTQLYHKISILGHSIELRNVIKLLQKNYASL